MNKKGILVLVLIGVLVGSAIVIMSSPEKRNVIVNDEITQEHRAIFPEANHTAIRINGDGDFDAAHGVREGLGTSTDPYIISNWVIDGSGKGAGIYIGNVTKYFTIENCVIYNATGGNFDTYHENAGIELYNIQTDVYLYNNTVYNNDGAGIFINKLNGNMIIGHYNHGEDSNRIFDNKRAGIYIAHSVVPYIYANMIYHNDVGIHIYSSDGSDSTIEYNGIAENTHEGIRIEKVSNTLTIFANMFYKNYGSTDRYNPNHPQATIDHFSTQENIYWYQHDYYNKWGNFWYDWAYNNDSNYNVNYLGGSWLTVEGKYPIVNLSNTNEILDYDIAPLKGVISSDRIMLTSSMDFYEKYNPYNGFVMGDKYAYSPVMSGLDIGAKSGYGLLISEPDRDFVIDGIKITNITKGSDDLLYRGNGIIIDHAAPDRTINILRADIHYCDYSGILITNSSAKIYSKYIYIHYGKDNSNGLVVSHSTYVSFSNSTITDQGRYGVYVINVTGHISGTQSYTMGAMGLFSDIIMNNGEGVYIPENALDPQGYGTDVDIYETSFFKNTGYGLHVEDQKDYTEIKLSNDVFYGNHGSGDTYDPSHNQVYITAHGKVYNLGSSNCYFHDWANNNRTNDMDRDGVVDWPYPVDGGGYPINFAGKWVDFKYEWVDFYTMESISVGAVVHVDNSNDGVLNSTGTTAGIVGYDDTYYYIIGWNTTKPYQDEWSTEHGIYVDGGNELHMKIYNVRSVYNGYGITAKNAKWVELKNSEIANNRYPGVWFSYSDVVIVSNNEIYNNYHGLELQGSSAYTLVEKNRIYKNDADGIYMISVSPTMLGVEIRENQIFANNIGLEGGCTGIIIHDNGLAYNAHYGIKLTSGHNHLYRNIFYENNGTMDSYSPDKIQAYDSSVNYWNNTNGQGNYWHDWSWNNRSNDLDGDWFVDYPYRMDGGAGSRDIYPMREITKLPLRIEGIGDLDIDHGVIGGDGSFYYPYVIAGWKINGKDAGAGIYIGNISENIRVRLDGLYINSTSGGSGVYHSNSAVNVYHFNGYGLQIYNLWAEHNVGDGVYVYYSDTITVDKAYLVYNAHGMNFYSCNYVFVERSNVSYSQYSGVVVRNTHYVGFFYNNIYHNANYGIYISSSTSSLTLSSYRIYNNTFRLNTGYGLYLTSSSGFKIYHNIFDRNHGASADGNADSSHIQAYDDESSEYTNLWNTTDEGNCWSDWNQNTPYQIDPDPYVARDHHPGCGFVPEMSNVVALVAVTALLIAITYRRRD